ncbi:hypothetical protein QFC19_000414 [Naganishia cerealis]|uniref:Uncharacterized protein n=1 Tax=Naganishia cerealis TaxID=610337 RepID=A0ACC2WNZ7_9TREE|nr:hypothetical protein QFC19_000414 [Naganishia cerealis]
MVRRAPGPPIEHGGGEPSISRVSATGVSSLSYRQPTVESDDEEGSLAPSGPQSATSGIQPLMEAMQNSSISPPQDPEYIGGQPFPSSTTGIASTEAGEPPYDCTLLPSEASQLEEGHLPNAGGTLSPPSSYAPYSVFGSMTYFESHLEVGSSPVTQELEVVRTKVPDHLHPSGCERFLEGSTGGKQTVQVKGPNGYRYHCIEKPGGHLEIYLRSGDAFESKYVKKPGDYQDESLSGPGGYSLTRKTRAGGSSKERVHKPDGSWHVIKIEPGGSVNRQTCHADGSGEAIRQRAGGSVDRFTCDAYGNWRHDRQRPGSLMETQSGNGNPPWAFGNKLKSLSKRTMKG